MVPPAAHESNPRLASATHPRRTFSSDSPIVFLAQFRIERRQLVFIQRTDWIFWLRHLEFLIGDHVLPGLAFISVVRNIENILAFSLPVFAARPSADRIRVLYRGFNRLRPFAMSQPQKYSNPSSLHPPLMTYAAPQRSHR